MMISSVIEWEKNNSYSQLFYTIAINKNAYPMILWSKKSEKELFKSAELREILILSSRAEK